MPDPPNAASEQFLPYIVGTYTIQVVATDSSGGTVSCDTVVTAVGHGLRVEMSAGVADVDLHLHNQNMTPWFTDDDCYYDNRPGPLWDPAQPRGQNDNPSLDFDPIDGVDVENTRIDQPVLGEVYTVAVHNFRNGGGDGQSALIQIWCGGVTQPTATFNSMPLEGANGMGANCNDGTFWKVATVVFNSPGSCAVTPLDQYTTGSAACGSF
jgi:hypothetical protein